MVAVGVAAMLLVSCGAGGGSPAGPATPKLRFTGPGQLQATVGVPFSYSFCRPALTTSSDLCGTLSGGTLDPTGGNPTYHFQLGAGAGFPPSPLQLGLNGILSGTPSTAGTSTFSVCAQDLSANSSCASVTMTVVGTVRVVNVSWSCTISASPLPGWRNCTGTANLAISKVITSGYVSVFMSYPSDGAFFHGELFVGTSGATQNVTVNLVNEYVSKCLASYATFVDVYDGRQTAGSAPVLVHAPVTLTSTCQ